MKYSKSLTVISVGVLCAAALGAAVFGFRNQIKDALKDHPAVWRLQTKMFPKNAAAFDRLARAYQQKAEYQTAIKEFAKISSFDPQWKDIDPAKAQAIKDNVNELIGYYEQSIKLNPKFIDSYIHLGALFEELGDKRKAAECYVKAVALNPFEADTHFRLALVFIALNDAPQAALVYTQLLALFPKEEEIYVRVINALSGHIKDDPENENFKMTRREAVEKFTKLINSKPPNAASYAHLGYVLSEMGDIERAISAYKSAIDLKSNDIYSLYNLANIYRAIGRFSEAKDLYSQAIKSDSKYADAYAGLGAIHFQEGKFDQAKAAYQQAIDLKPKDAIIRFQFGYILEKSGDLTQAVEMYTKAGVLDPKNADIYYNLGNVYLLLKQDDEAQKAYEKSISINANHLNATVNLCLLTFDGKKYSEAKHYCSEARLLGYNLPANMNAVLDQQGK